MRSLLPTPGRSFRGALLFLLAATAPACRCAPGPITTIDPGFRVSADTQALDFGRVQEGQTAARVVSLSTESRAALHLSLHTEAPFSAPISLDLPGGGAADVPVTFLAGDGRADGTLVLSSNGVDVTVTLTGLGVRPKDCVPDLPCHDSTWSLEIDGCVDSLAPDETTCDPGSLCLERGRCRAGTCVGQARGCDDFDLCTADACAMSTGCVHVPVVCPRPANPCRIPTCQGLTGCGEMNAPDLTPCGAIDCVSANVCQHGTCTAIPTPDGFECAPQVLCLGSGTCQAHVCQRSDAGVWAPAWATELGVAVSPTAPTVLEFAGNLYFTACGLPGAPDASLPDPACGVISYTGSGFERFTQPFADGQPRGLVHVSPRGVLVRADGGLELYSRLTGDGLLSLPGGVSATTTVGAALVVLRDEADGGAELASLARDGGVEREPWPAGQVLAMDEEDGLWSLGGNPATLRWRLADGGLGATTAWPGALTLELAVSGRAALAGGQVLVSLDDDGGVAVQAELSPQDAGPRAPLPRFQFLSRGTAVSLSSRCLTLNATCAAADWQPWTRAVDVASGQLLWEAPLLPQGADAVVTEAALLEATAGALVVVGQGAFDAGVRAVLEAVVQGAPPLVCPLPARELPLHGGGFGGGFFYLLATRPDGGTALEAWPLTGVSTAAHGWVAPGGLSGTRRPLR